MKNKPFDDDEKCKEWIMVTYSDVFKMKFYERIQFTLTLRKIVDFY